MINAVKDVGSSPGAGEEGWGGERRGGGLAVSTG